MSKIGSLLPPRIQLPTELNIQLTDTEAQLCTLLDECTTYLMNEKGITTSCRIAGGWVRDKLLGSQSNDIDIALEDMMGVPFAEHLSEFSSSRGIATGSISKVEQNPDQSKHLETAMMKILGLEMDFVNLRSEEYTTTSRIPTGVNFGSPVQDALRRDTTINALFYNVHSRTVEDLTEKGLDDLRNGQIRTPLAPQETFLDDPLRALRCIRFASRFGFELVPEVVECLKRPEIQSALSSKVSRDRIGEEVSKMMTGRSPLHSLALILDANLYQSIFCETKQTLSGSLGSPTKALACSAVLQICLNPELAHTLPDIHPIMLHALAEDPKIKARLYLAAILSPFRGVTYLDKKEKLVPAATAAIRESLKLGTQNHFLDGVPALLSATEVLVSSELLAGERSGATARIAIAKLLRDKAVHNMNTGLHWTTSLFFSMVHELTPFYDTTTSMLDVEASSDIVHLYNEFILKVEQLNLTPVVDLKPLLGGHDVVRLLNATPGQWTGRVMNQVLEWQFENPEGTKELCSQWLVDAHRAGDISVVVPEPVRKKPRTK